MLQLLLSLAAATPTVALPVQGELTDAQGAGLNGTFVLDLGLYATETGTSPIWTGQSTVDLHNGRFATFLGAAGDLEPADFLGIPEAWIEVGVAGGTPAGRVRVGWVPLAARSYLADEALIARDAQKLDGKAPSDYTLDTESIAWSRLTGVPTGLADGDNDTTYTAGTGLQLLAGQFSTNNVPWSTLTGVPTGLADGDNDTTYTAGAGITLNGTQILVNQSTIEGWATGAGYNTASEVDGALATLGLDVAASGNTANFTGSSANVSVAGTVTAGAVVAPGVIKQIRNLTLTDQQAIVNSTWAVIPNTSISLTTTGNSTLVIDFSAMFRTTSSAVGNVVLRVDGTPRHGFFIEGATHEEASLGIAVDVTAGNHTVDVIWRVENNMSELRTTWNDSDRYLLRTLRVLDVAR